MYQQQFGELLLKIPPQVANLGSMKPSCTLMSWNLRQFSLRSDHCVTIYLTHIKILCDNTTAVHCTNNMWNCNSVDCDKITKSIWDWAIKSRLWLSSAHIPGRLDREADEESRKTELRIKWKLNRTLFYNLLEYFQYYLEINLFASGLNAQLLRFFSYRPDPFAGKQIHRNSNHHTLLDGLIIVQGTISIPLTLV